MSGSLPVTIHAAMAEAAAEYVLGGVSGGIDVNSDGAGVHDGDGGPELDFNLDSDGIWVHDGDVGVGPVGRFG